jgi:hypothetical protein
MGCNESDLSFLRNPCGPDVRCLAGGGALIKPQSSFCFRAKAGLLTPKRASGATGALQRPDRTIERRLGGSAFKGTMGPGLTGHLLAKNGLSGPADRKIEL